MLHYIFLTYNNHFTNTHHYTTQHTKKNVKYKTNKQNSNPPTHTTTIYDINHFLPPSKNWSTDNDCKHFKWNKKHTQIFWGKPILKKNQNKNTKTHIVGLSRNNRFSIVYWIWPQWIRQILELARSTLKPTLMLMQMLARKHNYYMDKMVKKVNGPVYRNWLATAPYENALCGKCSVYLIPMH